MQFVAKLILTVGALGVPAAAAWLTFGPPPPHFHLRQEFAGTGSQHEQVMLQIPVKMESADGRIRQIHIELAATPIPEPGVLPLAMMAALLFLRRRR